MNEPGLAFTADDRFEKFEYANDDFPYYNGATETISGPKGWFLMFMVVIGFLDLILSLTVFAGGYGQFIPAILFALFRW